MIVARFDQTIMMGCAGSLSIPAAVWDNGCKIGTPPGKEMAA
jgi:hypothetical protein